MEEQRFGVCRQVVHILCTCLFLTPLHPVDHRRECARCRATCSRKGAVSIINLPPLRRNSLALCGVYSSLRRNVKDIPEGPCAGSRLPMDGAIQREDRSNRSTCEVKRLLPLKAVYCAESNSHRRANPLCSVTQRAATFNNRYSSCFPGRHVAVAAIQQMI